MYNLPFHLQQSRNNLSSNSSPGSYSQTIRHLWNPGYPALSNDHRKTTFMPAYSAKFSNSDVSFELFVIVTRQDQFTVHLTKTPYDAANTTLYIKGFWETIKTITIENWTNNRISEDVLIPFSATELYGRTIEFEIIWDGFVKIATDPPPVEEAIKSSEKKVFSPSAGEPVSSPSINLYDHMKYLLKTPDLADVVIMMRDQEIPVHKIILASQSSVFMAMFKSSLSESTSNRIEVTDVDIDIMKKVVEFLYTGKVDSANLNINEIISILAVADKYCIIELKNLCANVLSTRLTKDNALKIFEDANLYGLDKLIEEAITLMLKNKQEMRKSGDFKDLYDRKPEILFEFMIRMMEK